MFKSLFKKMDSYFFEDDNDNTKEEKFFSNVVGYEDIKKLLLRSIVGKEPVHVLLTGPPASSKTVFLLEMLRGLDDAYFVDAVGASGAGMTDHLFNNTTKYILIDEIDKMKKNDQMALLNVLETGILSETKLNGKSRQKKIKLWIFATCNDAERLSTPLRSRFMELHLQEYTFEEFTKIVQRLLKKKYQMNMQLSEKIAYSVWHRMKSKDVRDAINIAKITNVSADVEWLVNLQMKYGANRVN
jgi:Holliday junction DNA helicase RuvB